MTKEPDSSIIFSRFFTDVSQKKEIRPSDNYPFRVVSSEDSLVSRPSSSSATRTPAIFSKKGEPTLKTFLKLPPKERELFEKTLFFNAAGFSKPQTNSLTKLSFAKPFELEASAPGPATTCDDSERTFSKSGLLKCDQSPKRTSSTSNQIKQVLIPPLALRFSQNKKLQLPDTQQLRAAHFRYMLIQQPST